MKTLEQSASETPESKIIEYIKTKIRVVKDEIRLSIGHKNKIREFNDVLNYKFFIPSTITDYGLCFKRYGAGKLIMLLGDSMGTTKRDEFNKLLPSIRHWPGLIYAAGAIEKAPDHGVGSRIALKESLKMINIKVISPTDFEYNKGSNSLKEYKESHSFDEVRAFSSMIVEGDLQAVKNTDGIVVFLDEFIGVGSTSECTVAKAIGKPVYAILAPEFKKENINPWLLGTITRIFDNYNSLRDFLLYLEVPQEIKIIQPKEKKPPRLKYISLAIRDREERKQQMKETTEILND